MENHSVQIPPDIDQALSERAKHSRRSRDEIVVAALRLYLGVHATDKRREAQRVCHEINQADAIDEGMEQWVEDAQRPLED